MKRKYIYIIAIAVVLVAMLAIPAMQKPKITVPENPFPISEEAINTAIKNAGLELTLGEKTVLDNDIYKSTAYFLMNGNNKIVGTLQISFNDTERLVAFSPLYNETNLRDAFQKEDYPKAVQAMAELYGGLADNTIVYTDFSKNIPTDSTMWHKRYDKIIATIAFISNDENPDGITEHGVRLMNDATLQSIIISAEKNIKDNKERLAPGLEKGDKRSIEIIASYEKTLERLKAVK